ncbi:MAG: chromate transporter [Intestinibacter bartlettii]|uniref:chromate transporter n=1 Tax=Intestinibacter bartlettii TaxID=261299 RepID=UPI0026F1EA3F|nr:chromate transporter [Intestinibacter bartlettii]MDO5011095.1 chromate transporter [Intestinibacter bartlettii]
MLILFRLFYEFFKTGLFAVGGGLATMPFLYNISESTGWFSKNDLTNMIAVSESTPGPLGVNMSTYVGFSTAGIPGGIVATLGLVCPAIFIIIIISKFLKKFKQNPYVEAVFHTIRPTSTGLIVGAGWGVVEITMFYFEKYNISSKLIDLFNFKSIIFALILFVLIKYTNKHPVIYIALSAIVGILLSF